jgi:hypothetical protein
MGNGQLYNDWVGLCSASFSTGKAFILLFFSLLLRINIYILTMMRGIRFEGPASHQMTVVAKNACYKFVSHFAAQCIIPLLDCLHALSWHLEATLDLGTLFM